MLCIATRFLDEANALEPLNAAAYYRYADVGRDFAEHGLGKLEQKPDSG